MVKVIYDTTEDCKHCLYNKHDCCYRLGKYLHNICFERDCPLPTLKDVESFTRYITRDKTLQACGNCKHWLRWGYNRHIKTEIGVCKCHDKGFLSVACNTKACEKYTEV